MTPLERAARALCDITDEELLIELDYRRFKSLALPDACGCWFWSGPVDKRDGYSHIYLPSKKKTRPAHRFSFEYYHGPISKDKVIDHICRNRHCVNPAHLRQVTNAENVLSGIGVSAQNSRKKFCIRGHSLEDENLYIRANGDRSCRACRLGASNRHKARTRQAMIDAALDE